MVKHVIDFIEEEHIYLVDGIEKPSVTNVIKPITAQGYNAINPSVLEKARWRGSMVHEATQLIDYGDRPSIDGEILPYIKAYLEFLRDFNPTWEGIEDVVYDEGAEVCGTVDRHGWIDGEYTVVDIKAQDSPSVSARIAVCAQTAEYARAIGKSHAARKALYLRSNGTYSLMDCCEYEQKRKFIGIMIFDQYLDIYREIERIKKNGKRRNSV